MERLRRGRGVIPGPEMEVFFASATARLTLIRSRMVFQQVDAEAASAGCSGSSEGVTRKRGESLTSRISFT